MDKYAATKKLVSELDFDLWVPYCLNKLNHTIAAVNAHTNKRTHKYVAEGPNIDGNYWVSIMFSPR